MNKPIITSLLDNDLYKLTMMMAVYHQFTGPISVEYEFKNRGSEDSQRAINHYADEIADEIKHYCSLKFEREELAYLSSIPFFKFDFINYLSNYQTSFDYVKIQKFPFKLEIKGPWLQTILMEVPILAIINEVYFRNRKEKGNSSEGIANLNYKIGLIKGVPGFKFADFGTRRRYSGDWQSQVVNYLSKALTKEQFVGTSNVLFAKQNNIKAIGTMAHEWIQAGQAFSSTLRGSQVEMLQLWANEYRGDLGIALSDTLGIDAFFNDFDKYFAKLFDGVRQDSGDPIIVGRKVINHYKKLGIDPKTKTIIFSDGLNFPMAIGLYNAFKDEINISFGIGTNLTNDFDNIIPLQVVIKMQKCDGHPVAKISDTKGKVQCQDDEYLVRLKKEFNIV